MAARLDLSRPPTRLIQQLENDCFRTALAMVLGLESAEGVPHLHDYPSGRRWPAVRRWLNERGVEMVEIPLPGSWGSKIETCLATWLHGIPAILQGRTCEGHGHVVAVVDGRIVDTVDYTTSNPLTEPDTDGFYWLSLIVPLRRKDG